MDAPKQCHERRLGRTLCRLALEANEAASTTSLATPSGLPLLYLRPCTFVDRIVDGYNRLHVGGMRVVVLAGHSGEELRLRWVDPVPFLSPTWYRGYLAFG